MWDVENNNKFYFNGIATSLIELIKNMKRDLSIPQAYTNVLMIFQISRAFILHTKLKLFVPVHPRLGLLMYGKLAAFLTREFFCSNVLSEGLGSDMLLFFRLFFCR